MSGNATVVLVDCQEDRQARVRATLSGWRLVEKDGDALMDGEPDRDVRQAGCVMVFSEKDRERHTLEVCRAIRGQGVYDRVPLLVAITIYQMPLGNDVRRLDNADFIFVPLKEPDLRERLASMGDPTPAETAG